MAGTGRILALLQGGFQQRAEAYTALDGLASGCGGPSDLHMEYVEELHNVAVRDAKEVDAAEWRRVRLLVAALAAGAETLPVTAVCIEHFVRVWEAPDSAFGRVRSRTAAELTTDDALTLAADLAWWACNHCRGMTSCDNFTLETMSNIYKLYYISGPGGPGDEIASQLMPLVVQLVRERVSESSSSSLNAGLWFLMFWLQIGRPRIAVMMIRELGVLQLAADSLRRASPLDHASFSRNPSGYWGAIFLAVGSCVHDAPRELDTTLGSILLKSGLVDIQVAALQELGKNVQPDDANVGTTVIGCLCESFLPPALMPHLWRNFRHPFVSFRHESADTVLNMLQTLS